MPCTTMFGVDGSVNAENRSEAEVLIRYKVSVVHVIASDLMINARQCKQLLSLHSEKIL